MARILILSDDREMDLMVDLVLKSEGYECNFVRTVQDARSHLQNSNVDLSIFVLPLRASEPDGWNFYTDLKAESDLCKIPIIIYTSRRYKILPEPTDYGDILLTKPLPVTDLITRVGQILNTKEK